jgi:hypothetical protein
MSEAFQAGPLVEEEFDEESPAFRESKTNGPRILAQEACSQHRPRPVCESRTAEAGMDGHPHLGT